MNLKEQSANRLLVAAVLVGASLLLPAQVLSQVLSWPVAAVIIALVFFTRFEGAVDQFLRNVASVKLPGGVEVQTQSPVPSASAMTDENGSLQLTREQREHLTAAIVNMAEEHSATTAQRDQLLQACQQERLEKMVWKFSYLNVFFVQTTKNVLFWFSQSPAVVRVNFHNQWQSYIPDFEQRETILRVLTHNGLLEDGQGNLRITPEGYAFLQFIGRIPYAPPASGSVAGNRSV